MAAILRPQTRVQFATDNERWGDVLCVEQSWDFHQPRYEVEWFEPVQVLDGSELRTVKIRQTGWLYPGEILKMVGD